MQKALLFFLSLGFFFCCYAQRIQTIVPNQPVVVGNAFQVQYVISNPSDLVKITSPSFEDLRLVSGPNHYLGNAFISGKMQEIENITYTVVPLKTGKIIIKGIVANFKNGGEKSNDVAIQVIPQPRASFNSSSSYTDVNLYAPSSKSDLNKLVDENLFVRAEVDRKVCFLGEAIVATFKLYSRLQSVSEVINAPSLYGFSVMDILNINEAHQSVETINGKVFNTSVLRKMQLYPVQTGKLMIDEMQLKNEVEFRDSGNGEKIKIEKLLASDPIEINVKALPGEEPKEYSGAVGQFSLTAQVQSKKIGADQQGRLIVIISGKGNFIQFGEPVIHWPDKFDAFDAEVVDRLNKNEVPAGGSREYIFGFTVSKTGTYTIQPVSFSYFDPATKTFKSVRSDTLQLEVNAVGKNENKTAQRNFSRNSKTLWVALLVLVIGIAGVFFLKSKKKAVLPAPVIATFKRDHLQKFHEINSSGLRGKEICLAIQKLLAEVKRDHSLTTEQEKELLSIQRECQIIIYTELDPQGVEEQLKKRTWDLIRRLK